MKSSVRSIVTLVTLSLAGIVPGATAGAGQPPPSAEQQPAADARKPHGFVQLIGDALSEVSLRPDQEADVEAVSNVIEPLQLRVDDAESAVLLALADQVGAGRIDRGALEGVIAGYAKARHEVSGELRAAIEQLHDVLDADQRADFADALEARIHDVRRAILSGERLDDLAQKLDLSDAQQQQIRDDLQHLTPALQTERAAMHQAIEGFRGDTFSIEQYLPQAEVVERARLRAGLIVDVTESIMGLLDAHQRAALAARIHEAALVRAGTPDEDSDQAAADKGPEHVGAATQHLWVGAGVRRGPFGGVRGGVVVAGGAPGFAWRRVGRFPVAAGWGWGW